MAEHQASRDAKQEKEQAVVVPEAHLITGDSAVIRGTKVAKELANVINKQKLFALIQGKKYVTVEGWTTLGAMMGVFPNVVSVERITEEAKEIGDEIAYTATVELMTPTKQIVGRAQAICSSHEKGRRTNDEYVVSSMAQTRAIGKAFRMSFSWIMKLANYEVTPMEEMPEEIVQDTKPAPVARKTKTTKHKNGETVVVSPVYPNNEVPFE